MLGRLLSPPSLEICRILQRCREAKPKGFKNGRYCKTYLNKIALAATQCCTKLLNESELSTLSAVLKPTPIKGDVSRFCNGAQVNRHVGFLRVLELHL
jgi:hypothetical protein